MTVTQEQLARLKWQCRRGMLELDLLLLPFVEEQYSLLPPDEQTAFTELLTYPDQEIYAWLTERETPEDQSLALMAKKILNYAKSKS